MGVERHSLVDLPSPSSLGDRFGHLIDGGRGQVFQIATRNLTCVCDYCCREDNLAAMVQIDQKLLERYWYLSQNLFDLTEAEDEEFKRLCKVLDTLGAF